MPYTDFSLKTATARFGLRAETAPLFSSEARVPISAKPWLEQTLARGTAFFLSSEKARSEFIVAPLLLAVRELSGDAFCIFSGLRLDVAPVEGLSGPCDFILTVSPPNPIISSPLVVIVQAKQGDMELGWGVCAAQMVAMLRFNQSANSNRDTVYGCVTTGREWQFIRLYDKVLTFDTPILALNQKEIILATFLAMLK